MNDDETLDTLRWVDPFTAELREWDVNQDTAATIAAGVPVAVRSSDDQHRRFSNADGRAGLQARLDQLDARMGDLLSAHPWLKAL